MIECIFTLDYEIYGNGTGALKDLVLEPGEVLRRIFQNRNARFVAFVEVAELERIEARRTDPAIKFVIEQVRAFHREGFEVGLHLHPQWCNARHEGGHWQLDYREYNLCTLPQPRIVEIVQQSLKYLRYLVDDSGFSPLSFRAGNWLFQPTRNAAQVLGENGFRIDSSVFKGGLQHSNALDYRRTLKNGDYWAFSDDVTRPDNAGPWIEVPIYTQMVPVWKMRTKKRMQFRGASLGMTGQKLGRKWTRARDFFRFLYPLKLDFCRMTLGELTSMMDGILRRDQEDPQSYRPIVAIGHTKDLTDPETVDAFLAYLHSKSIEVATFKSAYPRLYGTPGVARGAIPSFGDAPQSTADASQFATASHPDPENHA